MHPTNDAAFKSLGENGKLNGNMATLGDEESEQPRWNGKTTVNEKKPIASKTSRDHSLADSAASNGLENLENDNPITAWTEEVADSSPLCEANGPSKRHSSPSTHLNHPSQQQEQQQRQQPSQNLSKSPGMSQQQPHRLHSYMADGPPEHLSRAAEDTLCVDMLRLFETLLPTAESHARRHKFVSKIDRILNTEWPGKDIKVHMFGSSVNNLGTSTSDVDICVTTPWDGLNNVHTLAKVLRKHGMKHIYCVTNAKVPIVKLWDPEYKFACDINVNNTLALHNTRMIATYVAIDPRVRPLAMIIKHWARRRELNDAAEGGTLSTYTWTCMIINFLQMRDPPILPSLHKIARERGITSGVMAQGVDCTFFDDISELQRFGEKNTESLGGLLYAFFRRFAFEFDYEREVVSVREGRYMTKDEKSWHIGKNARLLCVEEPFSTSRNLGNSADEVSVIGLRQEFRRAINILHDKVNLALCCRQYIFPNQNQNQQGSYNNHSGGGNSNRYNYQPEWTPNYRTYRPARSDDHPHPRRDSNRDYGNHVDYQQQSKRVRERASSSTGYYPSMTRASSSGGDLDRTGYVSSSGRGGVGGGSGRSPYTRPLVNRHIHPQQPPYPLNYITAMVGGDNPYQQSSQPHQQGESHHQRDHSSASPSPTTAFPPYSHFLFAPGTLEYFALLTQAAAASYGHLQSRPADTTLNGAIAEEEKDVHAEWNNDSNQESSKNEYSNEEEAEENEKKPNDATSGGEKNESISNSNPSPSYAVSPGQPFLPPPWYFDYTQLYYHPAYQYYCYYYSNGLLGSLPNSVPPSSSTTATATATPSTSDDGVSNQRQEQQKEDESSAVSTSSDSTTPASLSPGPSSPVPHNVSSMNSSRPTMRQRQQRTPLGVPAPPAPPSSQALASNDTQQHHTYRASNTAQERSRSAPPPRSRSPRPCISWSAIAAGTSENRCKPNEPRERPLSPPPSPPTNVSSTVFPITGDKGNA
ncbi:uncharacterized protein VTP21DRAFT_7397 [Calcarisporiella thermophila]|uniref:uncharacterized protein n=1 Tax=Calcarisporiella thermophila TaxID=911321 RepID=UPI0037438D64